jgi:hypothetical protein
MSVDLPTGKVLLDGAFCIIIIIVVVVIIIIIITTTIIITIIIVTTTTTTTITTTTTTIIIIIIVNSIRVFLRAFANFRKETIGFANPVSQSARTERLGSHWTDFREI